MVVRPLPFHCTAEPETKPDPVTVREKLAAPAVIVAGLSDEMPGAAAAGVDLAESPHPATIAREARRRR